MLKLNAESGKVTEVPVDISNEIAAELRKQEEKEAESRKASGEVVDV